MTDQELKVLTLLAREWEYTGPPGILDISDIVSALPLAPSETLEAVKAFEWATLAVFAGGCVLGLLSFSRVLSWAFHHCRMLTLALLGGFMLGSLNKVWPWKYTLAYSINEQGQEVPLVQDNLLPESYQVLTGIDPQFWPALGLMVLGALLGILMDRQQG